MIQKYIINNTEKYRVRIQVRSTVNRNLRITKQEGGIDTEAQAKKREVQLKKEIEREIFDLESKGVIFSDLVSNWNNHSEKMKVATGQRLKVTQDDYLGSIRKWFKAHWHKPALSINPYVVTEVFENMKNAGLCFGHRKKLKQVLKSMFDYGIQSGMLSLHRSPTFEVMLKNDSEKKPEILTHPEIQLLVRKAYESNHEWRRIWLAALLTGMRSGELYALEWSDINFENNLINVNKSYNCRMRASKSTKSGYWRQVPISTDLLSVLKEQQIETGKTKYVFPRFWEWDRGLQAKVLRRFCFIHGLPSIKFHTLRACFATQMLRSGVEAARVMKVCGWKELKTMQHYIRLAGIEIEGVTEGLKIFPTLLNKS
jgi:integrase